MNLQKCMQELRVKYKHLFIPKRHMSNKLRPNLDGPFKIPLIQRIMNYFETFEKSKIELGEQRDILYIGLKVAIERKETNLLNITHLKAQKILNDIKSKNDRIDQIVKELITFP